MIGVFNVLCCSGVWSLLMKIKKCSVPSYGWLSREQSDSQSGGICCVWGFAVLPARAWVDSWGLLCLFLFPQVLYFQCRTRDMNWGRTKDHCFSGRRLTSDKYGVMEEKSETGTRPGHLCVCLLRDVSLRHPAGRWALVIIMQHFEQTPTMETGAYLNNDRHNFQETGGDLDLD